MANLHPMGIEAEETLERGVAVVPVQERSLFCMENPTQIAYDE